MTRVLRIAGVLCCVPVLIVAEFNKHTCRSDETRIQLCDSNQQQRFIRMMHQVPDFMNCDKSEDRKGLTFSAQEIHKYSLKTLEEKTCSIPSCRASYQTLFAHLDSIDDCWTFLTPEDADTADDNSIKEDGTPINLKQVFCRLHSMCFEQQRSLRM